MALSDLAVYSEYAYSSMTEVLDQQIELFNAASAGTIVLDSGAHQGDYSDTAFYKKISGLVKRRNAYGSGTVTSKQLEHLVDTMVKVAAGTPPIDLDPGQFKWIQRNPEEAGAAMGQQLAGDMLADFLNTGIMAAYAALGGTSAVVFDGTAATIAVTSMNSAARLFGDQYGKINSWIMHSKVYHDMIALGLTNAERLFTYGTVAIMADTLGRPFIVSDCPTLFNATPTPDEYYTLGLVGGGLNVHANNDFTDNFQTNNGDENIGRTYQAEWSFQVGVKGFAWDKTNGGASPNDTALAVTTNWDQYATSDKDLAGVVLSTQ